ncbi:MAG TPA: NAD-dependent epimerase/dehydratase family protein [Polyangiaceae bacterium]|jgi:UDP-glucose 4-epimerase
MQPASLSSSSGARDAHAGTVVVTGICGNLGRRVARALHRRFPVIGLDRRPFPGRPRDVEHVELELRSRRVDEVFRQNRVMTLVHLGVRHNLRDKDPAHHTFNVQAFRRLTELVERYGVKKLIYLSSANVYGPRPDNPQLLTEEAPLLGAAPFSEIGDLVELDMWAQSFLWQRPDVETVILRPSHILGTVRNAPSNYLRLPVVPTLLGFDPMVQLVHQDDVVLAIELVCRKGARGVFNIAGPPPIALSQAVEGLGRKRVSVPTSLARAGVRRLFRWHLTSFPAPELDFIRYVCMVDDSRARRELGYAPRRGLDATLRAVDEERWV